VGNLTNVAVWARDDPPVDDIPPVVRNKAVVVGAQQWLDDLPDLLAALQREWDFRIGRSFDGGTEAHVVEATLADGTLAVLKLLVPRSGDAAANEITVLRRTDGEGCARLLRADADRGALLLERLGPSMYDLGLPVEERLDRLADVAAAVWRPAPGVDLPTGKKKAAWLAEHIATAWEELGRPCAARTVDDALACAQRRADAHDDERAMLVHGDVHQRNALATIDGAGFKLVDPDGLLAEPEYDLGIVMREDPVELLQDADPHDRAHRLAHRTGCDATAIWEWGVVERVSTGLLATRIELQPVGREMLATADAVAPRP
jgi:streptomycin 6-kinase